MFNSRFFCKFFAAMLLVLSGMAFTTQSADAYEDCCAPKCCAPKCCAPKCCAPKCCAPKCCVPTCCTPCVKMVSKTFCLVDPCTCCTSSAKVCIPETCCAEEPCVTWRNGLFGRRIATLCWKGCCEKVEVVVTRRGRVIVR